MMRREQGFTLIEIMIVVFVIGISVAMVSFSMGGDSEREQTRKAAGEFVLRADYIAEQAVLKGETYGLFATPRITEEISFGKAEEWCYQWRRVRDRQWENLPELPDQECLAPGMKLDFVIDEKLWKYDPELEYQDPVMGFFPSGDGSGEVEVAIYMDGSVGVDDVQRIELSVIGELHWLNEEALIKLDRAGR
jgi:general secretion pathway protein H